MQDPDSPLKPGVEPPADPSGQPPSGGAREPQPGVRWGATDYPSPPAWGAPPPGPPPAPGPVPGPGAPAPGDPPPAPSPFPPVPPGPPQGPPRGPFPAAFPPPPRGEEEEEEEGAPIRKRRVRPPPHPGPRPLLIAIGIALCSVLYLLNSWNRDFWAPEEPDFAAVMRDIAGRMDQDRMAWLVPTIGGELYIEKPPLLYWLAGIAGLTGLDHRLAYRIPSAAAAALLLWTAYLAGRRFLGGKTAAAGAAIIASSALFFTCGSWFLTDMLFAAFVSLSIVSFGISLLLELGSRKWPLIGWAALALAGLSKTVPLALVLGLGPIFILALIEWRGPGLRMAAAALRPALGIPLFLAICGPWYAYMTSVYGWDFIDVHFLHHNIGRLIASESHRHGFFYYLGSLPVDFLPWSVFLPLAVFSGTLHIRSRGIRFFAIWALWTFVLLSFISSKQGKYLLPLWPALGMLVAEALFTEEEDRESIWEGFLGEKLFAALVWALRIPLAVAVAIVLFLAFGGDLPPLLEPFLGEAARADVADALGRDSFLLKLVLISLVAGAGFYAAGVIGRRRLREERTDSTIGLVAGATLLALLAGSFLFSDMNRYKSARSLGEVVGPAVSGSPLALYGMESKRAAVHYYLNPPPAGPVPHFPTLEVPPHREEEQKRILESERASLEDRDYFDRIIASGAYRDRLARFPELGKDMLEEYLRSPRKVYLLLDAEARDKLRKEYKVFEGLLHEVPVSKEPLRLGSRDRAVLATNRP